MKSTIVTVNEIKTSIQNDALEIANIKWIDVSHFQIDGNKVTIFTIEKNNPVTCEFCGFHTTEGNYTSHILAKHPAEQ